MTQDAYLAIHVALVLAVIGGFAWLIIRQDAMHDINGKHLDNLADRIERRLHAIEQGLIGDRRTRQ